MTRHPTVLASASNKALFPEPASDRHCLKGLHLRLLRCLHQYGVRRVISSTNEISQHIYPFFNGNEIVFLHANSSKQIQDGITFLSSLKINKIVLVGGIYSYKQIDLLIKNKILNSLAINDNDLGPDGGECIGIALS